MSRRQGQGKDLGAPPREVALVVAVPGAALLEAKGNVGAMKARRRRRTAGPLEVACCCCASVARLAGGYGVGAPGESAGEGRAATGLASGSAQARDRTSQASELCTDEATA